MLIKKDNYCKFPTISIKTKKGKNTLTTIYFGLVQKDANVDIFKKLTHGSELTNMVARIKEEYYDHSIITDNVKGFIVLKTGYEGGKISFKAATYVLSGTNLGKKNQTNAWTQTIEKATSKYNDRNRPNESPELFRPMLANGDAVSKDMLNSALKKIYLEHKNNFLVQLKYDGHRMVCRLSDQYCYSRTAEKTYISDELKDELSIIKEHIKSALPQYKNYNVFLDGEYYAHGESLQTISSAVRYEGHSAAKSNLVYYVFDVATTTKDNKISDEKCIDRISCLGQLRKYFENYNFSRIVFVKSWVNSNFKQLKEHFHNAIKNGYEGLVLKVSDGIYEPGHNNYHSKMLIKVKQLLREEFLIYGHKTGKGKAEGKIILQCKLTEDTIIKAIKHIKERGNLIAVDVHIALGNTFWVKPKMTDEESEEFYKDVESGEIDIMNKLYTVEFRDWSDKLLPIQAVGITLFES